MTAIIKPTRRISQKTKMIFGWNSSMEQLCGSIIRNVVLSENGTMRFNGWSWHKDTFEIFDIQHIEEYITKHVIIEEELVEYIQKSELDSNSKS